MTAPRRPRPAPPLAVAAGLVADAWRGGRLRLAGAPEPVLTVAGLDRAQLAALEVGVGRGRVEHHADGLTLTLAGRQVAAGLGRIWPHLPVGEGRALAAQLAAGGRGDRAAP